MYDYAGGTFGCFGDITICIYGTFCVACQMGKNVAKTRNEECVWWHCCAPQHPLWVRKKVISDLGLSGNPTMDCVFSSICAPCVVCQDGRQLNGA